MYSIEEKRKAVQLYIDSNFSERIVINNLGYPSPNALRQWHREYTETGMLHCKVERQQRYSQEQIKTAIAHYDEHDGSIIATCRALGYPNRNTMSQWIRENPQGKERPLSKRCKSYRELVRCSQEQKAGRC